MPNLAGYRGAGRRQPNLLFDGGEGVRQGGGRGGGGGFRRGQGGRRGRGRQLRLRAGSDGGEGSYHRDDQHRHAEHRLEQGADEAALGGADADLDGLVHFLADEQFDPPGAEEGADADADDGAEDGDGDEEGEEEPAEEAADDGADHSALAAAGFF